MKIKKRRNSASSTQNKWYIFIIVCAAFYLRFLGIDFGLPFLYDFSEGIIADRVFSFNFVSDKGNFTGLPVISYLLFFEYGLIFIFGKLFGMFSTLQDFFTCYLINPYVFYFLGRLTIGVFFGTASVYILYLLVKMLTKNDEPMALLSSLFFSVCFLHVYQSHFMHSDIPFTFFVLLGLLYTVRLQQHPHWKYFLIIGILIGISTSIKLSGILLLIPFSVSAVYVSRRYRKQQNRVIARFFISMIFGIFIFWIINPGIFFYLSSFVKQIFSGAFVQIQWTYHLRHSLISSMTSLLFISSLCGFVIALLKFRVFHNIILFAAFYYLLITVFNRTAERYIMPLLPLLSLFSALGVLTVLRHIIKKNIVLQKTVLFICSFILIFPGIIKILYADYLFLQKDTNALAYEWIVQNIPAQSAIVIDAYQDSYPRLRQTRLLIQEKLNYMNMIDESDINNPERDKIELLLASDAYSKSSLYQVYYVTSPDNPNNLYPCIMLDLASLEKYDIQYLVLSSMITSHINDDFLKILDQSAVKVKEYNPFGREHDFMKYLSPVIIDSSLFHRKRLGPNIKIYKIVNKKD